MKSEKSLLIGVALTVAIGLTLTVERPRMQSQERVPFELHQAVEGGGRVPVIVTMETPALDSGGLAGPAALFSRQAALRMELDPFVSAASVNGVAIVQRYDNFPFFSAIVDSAGLAWLESRPDVAAVRPPVIAYPQLAQSVPLINAPQAWAAGATGAGWYVAVVDTGVQKTHPFLAGKVALEGCPSGGVLTDTHPDAPALGVTLCPPLGGAQINRWWGNGSGVPCPVSPGCNHGTHVAGIATGGTGNPGGVSGVAPGARLFAIMAFRRNLAGDIYVAEDSLLESFDHIFTEHFLTLNERIAAVNLSIATAMVYPDQASCDARSPAVTKAIRDLRNMGGFPEAGVATVVASGNSGSLAGVSWPGCISSAIGVGSTTKSDLISDFTNRVPFLSLLAPGSNIISSMPTGADSAMSGTSQAAPHVSGAWAILKQAKPEATVTQVLKALQDTGVPINDPFAIPAASYKRIDIDAARRVLTGAAPAAPAPPVNVAGTVNGLNATVSWAPGVGGGLPTHYLVIAGTTSGGSQLGQFNVGLTTTASGTLGPGNYFVRVIAVNAAGQSAPSAEVVLAVGGLPQPPGTPGTLAASVNGNSVTFTWSAPSAGGAVGGYQLIASLTQGGPAFATLPVAGITTTVNNVPGGTYYVRVVAVNAAGAGPASNTITVSVGGMLAPGAPVMNPASVSGRSVTLSWTPASAGSAATQFIVSASQSPGGPAIATLPTPAAQLSVTSVPTGVYYVSVTATNAAGSSPRSNEAIVVVVHSLCTGPMQVVLTWNTGTSTELDLHGFEADGTEVSWRNITGAWSRLIYDSGDGADPELLCADLPAADGVYELDVAFFNGAPATAAIAIATPWGGRVFTRTLTTADPDLAHRVATITFPGGVIAEATGTRVLESLQGTARRR